METTEDRRRQKRGLYTAPDEPLITRRNIEYKTFTRIPVSIASDLTTMAASSTDGSLHVNSRGNEIMRVPPLGRSRSNSDMWAALYLVSAPLPANISVLKFNITSHDQGWSGRAENWSWTWFEVSILRPWQEDCCAYFGDITNAKYSYQVLSRGF